MAASAASASVVSSGQTVDASFDVKLNFAPNIDGWMDSADLPDCGDGPDGGLLCLVEGNWADLNAPITGTVTDPATGETGEMKSSCSLAARTFIGFTLSLPESPDLLPAVDYVDAGGDIALQCSWRVRFGDGSTLVGRASGKSKLVVIDPASSRVKLADAPLIDVVAGTGRYGGVVGRGTLGGANISFSLLDQSGELPFDFEIVTFSRAVSTAATAPTDSLDLELRAGRPEARIVTPARVKRSQLKSALHTVTSPRASCSLSARRSKKTVDLGTARAGADGLVRIPRKRGNALSAGRWTVSASCRGTSGVARATERITVTK